MLHAESDTAAKDARQLADYYGAALEFVDPGLAATASLDEIANAVERRQDELKQRPMAEIREELRQLTEALLFIQRSRPKLKDEFSDVLPVLVTVETVAVEPTPVEPAAQDEIAEQEPNSNTGRAGDSPAKHDGGRDAHATDQASVEPEPAKDTAPEPEPEPEPEIELGSGAVPGAVLNGGTVAAATQEESSTEPAEAEAMVPAPIFVPEPTILRLSEVLEHARATADESPVVLDLPAGEYQPPPRRKAASAVPHRAPLQRAELLPEVEAWPALRGILLIAWQLWLACFSGWTAVRLAMWPFNGYQGTPWWQLGLLVLLGVAVALGVGWGMATYRARTWRIMLPTLLSAVAVMLNLTAWWLAGVRNDIASMHPSGWAWGLAICASLAMLVVAFIFDLRVAAKR